MKKSNFPYSAVVITGGSSGIGKAFIRYILNISQVSLICNLSRSEPSEILKKNKKVHHFPCDLSKKEELENAVPKVLDLIEKEDPGGSILLINNSGFGSYGTFDQCDLSNQLEMIDINLIAVVNLTGLLLPSILKGGGAIMNIASLAAFQPTPYMATYGATKSFILNWSLALSEELRERNVHVLAVCPGPTHSNFFRRAGFYREGFRQPTEEVIEVSIKALLSGKKYIVTGWYHKLLACVVSKLPLSFLSRISGIILKRIRHRSKEKSKSE